MTAVQMPEIKAQQLWKTRRAPSRSSRATIMVISLPATVPKPTLEKVSQVGMALMMIHSP